MRILLFFLILCVISIMTGCSTGADEMNQINTIAVKVAPVKEDYLSIPIERSGLLSAQNEARLSFKIGGYVKEIHAEEGQYVKKGKLLASLDMSEITAQVIQAQSAYEKSVRDFERVQKLYEDSVATLEQKQNSATALQVTKANLEIARFNQRHAQIHAPSNGIILKRFVERNELISGGMPIFYFASKSQNWIIRIGVSDKELLQLQQGDSADIYFDSYPDIRFPATITELARAADVMTGTFEVELSLEKTSYRLMSGFVGRVRLYPSQRHKVSLIPIESLIEADGTEGFVYGGDEKMANISKIPIKIYAVINGFLAVSQGLEGIGYVISSGSSYITERSRITVVN
jgi:multidrug efflux system membrane fusion protein